MESIVSSRNSYVEALTPSVTAFEDKVFRVVIKDERGPKSRTLVC